ncbi:hypothetical protein Rhopal_003043-T1 [Rhodotorula paludigena]|uniref:Macrofage activating glycoprotein n=1 Tax=Rhodotorula paludigena TaxID=86838 RepID=A0AAV5GKL4_9BASI|nr:hypothetical protein Rhopal_003043-T1 [Rhodotorula paludigena]
MLPILAALPLLPIASAAYTHYSLGNLPHTSEEGQSGYNDCGTTDSQSSMCQTAHVNSVTDFCLWAPPEAKGGSAGTIGSTEEHEVAWCTAKGHGARLIPDGTIHSAHYLKTPHYTQVTGTGDFTKMNIQAGDEGGELDPHGATGLGNPIGSLVFANGEQIHEWTSFISDTEYCFRICHDASDAWLWCQHIYDIQGCHWNEPGNYDSGFDSCEGDSTEHPPGIYEVNGQLSTYHQEQGAAPTAHAAGKSSNCQAVATVGGNAAVAAPTTTQASSSAAQTSASSAQASSGASSGASASAASSAVSTGSASSAASSGSASSDSSSVSSSASASTNATSTISSTASMSTITMTSSLSSSSAASTTPASNNNAAAASTDNGSGAQRLFATVGASLAAVAGAIAVFA